MHYNMVMKKDKYSYEVCRANDATQNSTYEGHDSFSAKNIVCDKLQISASDNLACINDAGACSIGGSESKLGHGTSNDACENVEMFREFNEDMAKPKDPNVLGPNTDEGGGVRATKNGKMDLLPCGKEVEKKNPCSSHLVSLDQERVEAIIAQTPSCCPDLQVDAALDASDPLQDTKVILVGSSSRASAIVQPGEDVMDGKQSVDCLDCPDLDKKAHQFSRPEQLAEVKKHPLISSQEAEVDDSDLEEQDVKVCDICGDTGREDLLAICSRCSDGAEHTYCMREMLDKVPEGYWLCEECKSNEETEKQREENSEILDGKERSKQNSDSFKKLSKKDSLSGGTRADNDSLVKRLQNKRCGSDMEVDPGVKRQVLESMVQSPSTSSPGRNGVLSKDNSFKSIDKMNAKLPYQTSISGSEGLEKPWSPNGNVSHVVKGSFLKSNSFGTSSPKPKVKMVEEIPQKHKQGVDVKDASGKIVGKSMSFKGSLNRSNTTESKVKMLSPKDSHILESRGLKQAKDRTLFERKNSFKPDHSSGSQVVVDGCKNQVRGEVRRQHSAISSGGGSSAANSTSCSADARTTLSPKEGTSPLSRLDGFNNSNDHSRQGASVDVANGSSRSSALDISSVKSLKDGANEENKLKAAIQAAMQKRLDLCKRNKVPEKSTVISASNMHSVSETACLDRPNSKNSRNSISAKGIHEGEAAPICAFSCGPEVPDNNANQSKGFPTDSMVSPQARDLDLASSNVDHILRKSAIPEHEFAWLGSFEVYRGGNSPEHVSGIQAHISTCASYKVLEIVKKFPLKVTLNEVPRSCAWPTHFQDGGAEEDNVAVYFFARDVESYERSYKNLLEKMMKDDLALKGNIDGIELLIFPSKQLTKRSRRWNMLFFIWGVFRGRTENCFDKESSYVEKLDLSGLKTDKTVTPNFVCPLEKPSLYGSLKENISATESVQDVGGHNVFALVDVSGKQSPKLSNGDCDLGKHSQHQTNSYGKFAHYDSRNKSHSICYYPEQVGYADPDLVKIDERQTSRPPSEGGNSSAIPEMFSRDLNSVQEATSLGGSSEEQPVDIVKDERSQMKTKDAVKDEGCQMKLEGNLTKEEASMDDTKHHGQTSLEDNSWKEDQHIETKNLRGEVKMELELKQEEADAEKTNFEGIDFSVRDVKMENVTTIGQKRSLNEPNEDCNMSTPLQKRCKVVSGNEEMQEDSTSTETERSFFPVDSSIQSRADSLGWNASSSGNDQLTDGSPSLELALGVENRAKSGFFLGLVDQERYPVKLQDTGRRKEDEEEGNAALSLSLAFPFADKGRYVTGTEQAFPEKQRDK